MELLPPGEYKIFGAFAQQNYQRKPLLPVCFHCYNATLVGRLNKVAYNKTYERKKKRKAWTFSKDFNHVLLKHHNESNSNVNQNNNGYAAKKEKIPVLFACDTE